MSMFFTEECFLLVPNFVLYVQVTRELHDGVWWAPSCRDVSYISVGLLQRVGARPNGRIVSPCKHLFVCYCPHYSFLLGRPEGVTVNFSCCLIALDVLTEAPASGQTLSFWHWFRLRFAVQKCGLSCFATIDRKMSIYPLAAESQQFSKRLAKCTILLFYLYFWLDFGVNCIS